MDTLFYGLLFGTLLGLALARWAVRNRPDLAAHVGLLGPGWKATGLLADGPPAIDPESLPDTLTAEEVRVGAAPDVPDPELARLLRTLTSWSPKRHRDEYGFHRSFERFLTDNGYDFDELDYEPRIFWTPREREVGPTDRFAKPDFIVRKRVLVEIKRNLTGSGDSDRALGQMLRYLVAWRTKGPAVLVVCNEFDDDLRRLIARHVRSWKAQGVPILAYFVRQPEEGSLDIGA